MADARLQGVKDYVRKKWNWEGLTTKGRNRSVDGLDEHALPVKLWVRDGE